MLALSTPNLLSSWNNWLAYGKDLDVIDDCLGHPLSLFIRLLNISRLSLKISFESLCHGKQSELNSLNRQGHKSFMKALCIDASSPITPHITPRSSPSFLRSKSSKLVAYGLEDPLTTRCTTTLTWFEHCLTSVKTIFTTIIACTLVCQHVQVIVIHGPSSNPWSLDLSFTYVLHHFWSITHRLDWPSPLLSSASTLNTYTLEDKRHVVHA